MTLEVDKKQKAKRPEGNQDINYVMHNYKSRHDGKSCSTTGNSYNQSGYRC